ncbi:MAG: hypothetical protein ACRD2L_21440 [Terriglobia bacterium]
MGYQSKVQVIEPGGIQRQFYLISLVQAGEIEKGETIEWIVEDKWTLTVKRLAARQAKAKKGRRKEGAIDNANPGAVGGADHPVRAVWELVGQLDLKPFYAGIKAVEGVAGREPIDPQLLISACGVFAYSEGGT